MAVDDLHSAVCNCFLKSKAATITAWYHYLVLPGGFCLAGEQTLHSQSGHHAVYRQGYFISTKIDKNPNLTGGRSYTDPKMCKVGLLTNWRTAPHVTRTIVIIYAKQCAAQTPIVDFKPAF